MTLDGDRADRKGAISGGFIDSKQSRLEAAKSLKSWQVRIDDETIRIRRLKGEIARSEQEITAARDSLLHLEERRKRLIGDKEQLTKKLHDIQEEAYHIESIISKKVHLASEYL